MRDFFIEDIAKSAPLARVAGTTHARKSMSSIYRTSAPRRGIRISLTFLQMRL